MISKAYEAIEKYDMLSGVNAIVVGVSGGADSISLLHFLHFFGTEKNIKIISAHVNHGLRGKESVRDEKFVKNFCESLNIELFVKKANVKDLSEELKISLEESGRKIRYDFFEELAKKFSSKIATAHTLSDSVETVIFNLIRGTGLKGLCGIPPVRGNIIRPLIYASRGEIELYCKKNSLRYITDSSNFSREYTRNKIRLDLIPELKKINSELENNIQQAILNFCMDEQYLNSLAEKEFANSKKGSGFNIEHLKNLPVAIKNRVVMKIIEHFSGEYAQRKHVELFSKLIDGTETAVTLKNNLNAISKNSILTVKKSSENHKILWEYKIKPVNDLTEIDVRLIIKEVSIKEYIKMKSDNSDVDMWAFDFKRLSDGSVIRNRRAGDFFTLPKRNVTKTLKKLFNELKILQNERDDIPLIAHGNEVIWIYGIGTSKNYQPEYCDKTVGIIFKEILK